MQNSQANSLLAVADQKALVMRMMARAHSVSSRTGEELAVKWTKNICYYLYKRCAQFSPTKAMFGIGAGSIAVEHGFKIKELKNHAPIGGERYSDKGKKRTAFTRVRDVMIHRGNHRMFIASGWLNVKKTAQRAGERLQTQSLRNGAVIVDVQRGIFPKTTVTIINTSDFARSFHDKHNIVAMALNDEARDLAEYVSRKTHEDTEEILRTK